MVFDVSQTALDLNFDGLMIETHIDPDNAWSDASLKVECYKILVVILVTKQNASLILLSMKLLNNAYLDKLV